MLPEIQLPRGGGAIKSIGEKLTTDLATGAASFSVPIAVSPGRAQFGPELALTYSTGQGNGPWGIGFGYSPPTISRKTDRGVPRYFDDEQPDTFLLAGAEDLVPVRALDEDGSWKDVLDRGTHWVRRYRPRKESAFARIEQWQIKTDPQDVHWRVTTRDNLLQVFGETEQARISDGRRVFSWLLEETRDPKGQAIAYLYKQEDGIGLGDGHEAIARLLATNERVDLVDGHPVLLANGHRYPERIRYGNRTPIAYNDALPQEPSAWLFEVVFDYGEYAAPPGLGPDTERIPAPNRTPAAQSEGIEPTGVWPIRQDPFSDHRAGFERRQHRLCRRVLMFHRMPEHIGDLGVSPCLVRSTDFEYDEGPVVTYLRSVSQAGYRYDGDEYVRETAPPVVLEYAKLDELRDETKLQPLDDTTVENGPLGTEYILGSEGQRPGEEWVDLDGEGLPGLLTRDVVWTYRRNLGRGVVSRDAIAVPSPQPGVAGDDGQLVDISRDGRPDVVSYGSALPTYTVRDGAQSWLDPASFPADGRPLIDVRGQRTWLVDLDGNGVPDILQVQGASLVWYRSLETKGFAAGQSVPLPADDDSGARLAFQGDAESIFFADMSGDGLLDVVRVSGSSIEYWPSRGHGQFGRKIGVPLAQPLASLVEFEPNRVRFADVDGAGPSDIVYLGQSGVEVHRSESGNRFSAPERLASFGTQWRPEEVTIIDLLGAGRSCLVWSSRNDRGTAIRYLDPAGGEKPHLLTRYQNSLGGETRIAYRPSTEDYRRDRAAGTPWLTRLPFPVHVVARIERYDHISRAYQVSTYDYHHGHYDALEREFRGFAAVDEWVEEWTDSATGTGLFQPSQLEFDRDVAQLERTRTTTWFHTGAFLGGQRLEAELAKEYFDENGEAPLLADTTFEATWSAQEKREAARCLKGSTLRREVYAQDGHSNEGVPYTVEESSYGVRMVHAASSQHPGVFFVHLSEALSMHYERNPEDPRTTHSLTLEVDDFGNVLRAAEVAYPRRTPLHPEQAKLWATYSETRFTNRPEASDWYRLSVPVESATFELTGLVDPTATTGLSGRRNLLTATTLQATVGVAQRGTESPPAAQNHLRLLQSQRNSFFSDALVELPIGEVSALAIPCRTYALALTEERIATHLDHNPDLSPAPFTAVADRSWLAGDGGYVVGSAIASDGAGLSIPPEAETGWWAPTGSVLWDTANIAAVRGRFFQPVRATDPFGAVSTVTLDPYALVALSSSNAYGQVSVADVDYRTLTPNRTTDPNGASTEVFTDALGRPTAVVLRGSAGEGDSAASPTRRFEYHAHRWRLDARPSYSLMESKVLHGAADDGRRERTHVFANGSGAEAMTKVEAPRGRAARRDLTTGELVGGPGSLVYDDDVPRWIGNGRTVLNNKGLPVKQYEPYFSSTWDYEDEDDLVASGVTPLLSYDPLGRLIQTEFPDGTLSRVEFDVWAQTTFDANDLVEQSLWYTSRTAPGADPVERAAAMRALEHRDTPTTIHLDSLGRPFLSVVHDRHTRRTPVGSPNIDVDERHETRTALDIEGRTLKISRPQVVGAGNDHLYVLEQWHDFLGRPLHTDSPDAGHRWMLQDAGSRAFQTWDGNGNRIEQRYDLLHRPTETWVAAPSGTKLTTRVVYGRDAATPAASYLIGQVFRVYDGAGQLETPVYDFKGSALKSVRRLAANFIGVPDWRGTLAIPDAGLEPAADGFTTEIQFDALGRPIREVAPDGSETTYAYNESGQPFSVAARHNGNDTTYVQQTLYNARGQRTEVRYGNRVISTNTYDPHTFRVRSLVSEHGATKRQDLSYTYDPSGNITRISDAVHREQGNTTARTGWDYWYDSLYRLVRAEGREHGGQAPGAPPDWRTPSHSRGQRPLLSTAHPNDVQGLRNYEESYIYDPSGNIVEKLHHAAGTTSRMRYRYEGQGPGTAGALDDGIATSNRLLSTRLPGDAEDGQYSSRYVHDNNGNIVDFVGRRQDWDHANRLVGVDLGGGGAAHYQYGADGNRVRKRVVRQDGSGIERIYVGQFEIYREMPALSSAAAFERTTKRVGLGELDVAQIEQTSSESNAVVPPTRVRYRIADHLGSASLELTAAATGSPRVIGYEEFYAYGESSYRSTASGNTSAWTTASPRRYRYNGKERDRETGLYYYGARYYAPWICRWLSADPAGLADGPNSFSYVRAQPTSLVDRDGRFSTPAFLMSAAQTAWGVAKVTVAIAVVAAVAPVAGAVLAVIVAGAGGFAIGMSAYESYTGHEWQMDGNGRPLTDTEQSAAQGEAFVGALTLGLGGRTARGKMRQTSKKAFAEQQTSEFVEAETAARNANEHSRAPTFGKGANSRTGAKTQVWESGEAPPAANKSTAASHAEQLVRFEQPVDTIVQTSRVCASCEAMAESRGVDVYEIRNPADPSMHPKDAVARVAKGKAGAEVEPVLRVRSNQTTVDQALDNARVPPSSFSEPAVANSSLAPLSSDDEGLSSTTAEEEALQSLPPEWR